MLAESARWRIHFFCFRLRRFFIIDLGAVMTATSFAALTYIGFDGVTTLAEDVKNPKKNMLLAPILVCLFTGLFSILQIYLAQRESDAARSGKHKRY